MQLGKLREIIKDLPDDTTLQILFECTEAVNGFQYQVKVLDIVTLPGQKTLVFCHEADYEAHYSKRKNNE